MLETGAVRLYKSAGVLPGSSHTTDLQIGTPVATLSGARRNRVSVGASWPGVSILWLSEIV